MTIILGLIIGALTGWFASALMKARRLHGAMVDVVIGMIGALIVLYLLGFFGLTARVGLPVTLGAACVGAAALLALMTPVRRDGLEK